MNFLENLQLFFINLDKKTWYKYLAGFAAGFCLITSLILFYYYRTISYWKQEIETINESREQAKQILDKAARVEKQKAQVNAILAQDPNFKIKEYLQEVLSKFNIGTSNISIESDVTVNTREDNYQENNISYQLTGITMKQLTEFLDEIEQNKRLFIKELDITKSKKIPRTIDVNIQIATMMPKEAA